MQVELREHQVEQQIYQDAQNEISLRDILRIVRKRRWWLIATFIIVVGFVVGYLYQATPIYQSSATLWVESSQGSGSLEDLFSIQTTSTTRISTEVELIKSRRNIEKVIDNLDLVTYYQRLAGNERQISKSSLVNTISNMISVSTIKDTKIVKISVENANRLLARDIANTLAVVYNDLLKELAQESYTVRRAFIESQIGNTEQQVIEAEDNLRQFKEDKGIYLLDEETRILLENVTSYEKQIEPFNIQVGEADSKIDAFTEILEDRGIEPQTYDFVSADPQLRSSRAEMFRTKIELAGFTESPAGTAVTQDSRKNELYTRIIRLENEVDQLILELLFEKQQINDSYIRTIYTELGDAYSLKYLAQIDISYLTQLKEKYERQMKTLPALEQQLLDLQRDVSVKQNLYLLLLQNFEEAKIAEAAVIGTSTIIDKAVEPGSPIKPNKKMLLAIGVLLGLFLGVLLVFLVEAFDDAVQDEESIKRALGMDVPIVGRVPHIFINQEDSRPELVVYNNSTSPPAEAYKLVSTNIAFSDVEAPQVIAISSAEMAQGKTSISANTGIAMAQNGFKTLIIDADMRKPRLERVFGIKRNQLGMVNHLLQDYEISDLILKPLEDMPNIHILPVGPLPPNPTAVITSGKFDSMMEKLRGEYDRIIIDLPPFLAASDAMIVSRIADGMVLVVRFGQASKYGLKIGEEAIRNAKIKLIGIVLNDIARDDSYHYYHYYYYYTEMGDRGKRKKKRKPGYKQSSRKYQKGLIKAKRKRVKKRVEPEIRLSPPSKPVELPVSPSRETPKPEEVELPDVVIEPDESEPEKAGEPIVEAPSQTELEEAALEAAKPSAEEEVKAEVEKEIEKQVEHKGVSPADKRKKSPFDYISELEHDGTAKKGGDGE